MLNRQHQIKNFVIALLLLAILLCPIRGFSEDKPIRFSEEVASQMEVALEQAKIAEQQLTLAANGNAELQQQADILKGTVKLLEDQITVYKNMIDMQNKMAEAKDKAFEQQLKAATPTFMQKLQSNFLAGGIGAILAAVGILLL